MTDDRGCIVFSISIHQSNVIYFIQLILLNKFIYLKINPSDIKLDQKLMYDLYSMDFQFYELEIQALNKSTFDRQSKKIFQFSRNQIDYYNVEFDTLILSEYQGKIKLVMLKKYQNFYKISKTPECSFYEANLREDMNKVLIKRIKSSWSWNQMLKSKALKIQSTQMFFPKVLEIFRHNGSYFVVYEQPNGPSLEFADSGIKLQINDFYQVFNRIVKYITDLKQQVANLYIYPEWMFLHRNGVKICHFQPYFQFPDKKQNQQGHVFMYDLMKGSYHKEQGDEISNQKRIKNLNFNLGYIAYHLLTGQTTSWKEDQNDYYTKIKQIQRTAQTKIINSTNDQILASLVSSLLSYTSDPNNFEFNQNENQTFEQFKSYINRRNVDCKQCTKRQSFRIVEFSLEKMKLQKKMSRVKMDKKKKCVRPCCFKNVEPETNPEDDNDDRFKVVENYGKIKKAISRDNRLATQNVSSQSQKKVQQSSLSNRKTINRHKINSSCVLPELIRTQRKDSRLIEKMRAHQNRSTMFRKSMVGTIKTYLKTEY